MIALAEARRQGYETEPARTRQTLMEHVAMFSPFREALMSGYCVTPGFSVTAGYAALAMHGAGHPSDSITDSFVRCMIANQHDNGSWETNGVPVRPPLHPESPIPATALALRTLKLYTPSDFALRSDSAVSRGLAYLESAKAEFGDDFPFRLMGLVWSGAARTQIRAAARELIAQQRQDGGWTQTKDLDSDAYAA